MTFQSFYRLTGHYIRYMTCDKYYNHSSASAKKRYDFYFLNILWSLLITHTLLVDDLSSGIKMCACKMSA